MKNFVYGSHMSIAGGFVKAAEKTKEQYHANALQVFLKSPRGRQKTKLTSEEAKKYREYCKTSGIKCTVSHCSYLLNFAKDHSEDDWALQSLIADIRNTHLLGGKGVVLHIGKYLELPQKKAFAYLTKNLKKILRETKKLDTFIMLENTAGQGTEIGWRLEELEKIYKDCLEEHPRVHFCFDTAHAFAAGYDLRNQKKVKEVFAEFDSRLGLQNLAVIHLNDSKKPLGSRVDRHANLGKGEIGARGLKAVVKFAVKNNIPIIIETPDDRDDSGSHAEDLEIIRRWLKITE